MYGLYWLINIPQDRFSARVVLVYEYTPPERGSVYGLYWYMSVYPDRFSVRVVLVYDVPPDRFRVWVVLVYKCSSR